MQNWRARRGPKTLTIYVGLIALLAFLVFGCSGETKPTPSPVVVASAMLPTSVSISASATGLDDKGGLVQVKGGSLEIVAGGQGSFITLPIALGERSTLESFRDDESGIQVSRVADMTLIEIPVKNEAGEKQMTIRIFTTGLRGTGDKVRGEIAHMELESVEKQVDFTDTNPEVGTVSVRVLSQLRRLPSNAFLSLSISISLEPDVKARLVAGASAGNAVLEDVAYMVIIEKTNLEDIRDVGTSIVTLKVGRAWVEQYGLDRIAVVRLADDGGSELLDTRFARFDGAGGVVFEATSSGGLSIFAVVALEEAPEAATPFPTPPPTPAPTLTPAPTPSPMPVPTATPTFTPVPTPTPMPTSTPTAVSTPTPAPIFTPVPTPTPTPLPTPILVTTPIPTFTPAPAPNPTPVPTPTYTPVPSPTATPVPSPTATPAPTPTATPVPTPTATPVPTAIPTPVPTGDERYAVAMSTQDPDAQEYLLDELGISWFLDFGDDLSNVPSGARKVPRVRMGVTASEKKAPPICPPSIPDPTQPLSPETLETVLTLLSAETIATKVAQQPGSYWYLGGESNVGTQDALCATVFADVFHYYWQEIKDADPTAKVMSASVLNWDTVGFNCCVGIQTGESWVQEFISAYVDKYSVQPPVDVWLIDAYPLDWRATSNGVYFKFNSPPSGTPTGMTNHQFVIDQIQGMRDYLDTIPEQASKPIWVVEMGSHSGWDGYSFPCTVSGTFLDNCVGDPVFTLIQPMGAYHSAWLEQYLDNLLVWLEANSEAMKIERWFLFTIYRDVAAPSSDGFGGTILFDGPGVGANLTDLGKLYRDRAQ